MDYKVTDTELTAVANAIRTKGGTSAPLEWDSGFITAINDIPTVSTIVDYSALLGENELFGYSIPEFVSLNVTSTSTISDAIPWFYQKFQADSTQYYQYGGNYCMRIYANNNKTIMPPISVPPEATKLYVNMSVTNNSASSSYPYTKISLADAPGVAGHTDQLVGNRLKYYTITTDAMSSAEINAQSGLTINSTSNTQLSRQTLEIDMSDVTVESWFALYACHRTVYLYRVWYE